MKGIILAAGKGERIKELKINHKSLAVVQNKRVIDYSLNLLIGNNPDSPLVDEIIVVVGYNADAIINYLKEYYKGFPIKYVFQQELLGAAHAIYVAKDLLNDDFIMCMGDEIMINPRLNKMINEFYYTDAMCVCGTILDGKDYSMKPIAYEVDNSRNILKVIEKPKLYPNDVRGVGECIFQKKALDYLERLQPNPIRKEYEIGNWIQMIIDSGEKVRFFELADAYINVNYAMDIDVANKLLNNLNDSPH